MSLSVCVLASGSSGNAACVRSGHTTILIDSGLPAREIERRLFLVGMAPTDLDAILISHAHSDHFRSAGTLHRRYDIPVFTAQETDRAIRRSGNAASYPRIERTEAFPETVGGIEVETFATRHGGMRRPAGCPVGFVLRGNGSSLGIATDLGRADAETVTRLSGCDALILEANYDRNVVERKLHDPGFFSDAPYLHWVLSDDGHLSNEDCADLLVKVSRPSLRHVFLGHLSENHPWHEKDNNSFETARECVLERLDAMGLEAPMIHRTYRRGRTEGGPSEVITIG